MINSSNSQSLLDIINAKNPLPPEIEALPAEETVCKFCGISYLIHREVSRLKQQLQNYEQFHESYLDFYERDRPALLKQYQEQLTLNRKLQERLKEVDMNYLELNHKAEEKEKKLAAQSAQYERQSSRLKTLKTVMKSKLSGIDHSMTTIQHLSHTIKESMGHELTDIRAQLDAFRKISERSAAEAIDYKRRNQLLKTEKETLAMNLSKISAEYELMGYQKKDLESQMEDQRKSYLLLTDQYQTAKLEIEKLNGVKEALSSEKHYLAGSLTDLKDELNSVRKRHKEMELLHREERQKHLSAISLLEESKQDMEREMQKKEMLIKSASEESLFHDNMKDKLIEDLKKSNNETLEQRRINNDLHDRLKQAINERNKLQKEKTDMIAAHQARVKELQDNFLIQLHRITEESLEAKIQDIKVQLLVEKENALKEQNDYLNRKHQLDISNLENKLKELNLKSVNQEKSLMELKESHQLELHKKTEALERNASNERKKLQAEIENLSLQNEKFRKEIMESKLNNSSGTGSSTAEVNQLRKIMARKDEEIGLLKETVRRECEERVELLARLEAIEK